MKPWMLIHTLLLITGFLSANGGDAFTRQREKMVQEQIYQRGITDERILHAFLNVKRHLFLPPQFVPEAYDEKSLNLEEGLKLQTPYITAIMTQVIAPDFHKKVLLIGTGTGYDTAILAELVSEVYTIEIKPDWAQKARQLLFGMGYRNIKFMVGNGYLGWKEFAPFDGIIVTCAPDTIPKPLLEQLALGGRMVIPVEYASKVQEMILIEKDRKGVITTSHLFSVQIVPMIRGTDGR